MLKASLINPIQEINEVAKFLQTTFQNANKTTAIIAVSGGIDSATSLLLTTKALSPEHVYTLHLPTKTTSPIHTTHAQMVIDIAQIPKSNQITINIAAIIQKTWRIIHRYESLLAARYTLKNQSDAGIQEFAPAAGPRLRESRTQNSDSESQKETNRLRLANLTARIRMMLLYDQAKKLDALVVGTENLSEHLLGYFTRFGDDASDIEPLRLYYKTQVIEIAKALGVPQPIIDKPASADLWPHQTDALELGFTYEAADPILKLYQEGAKPSEIMSLGYVEDLVTRIINRVESMRFKQQVPFLPPVLSPI